MDSLCLSRTGHFTSKALSRIIIGEQNMWTFFVVVVKLIESVNEIFEGKNLSNFEEENLIFIWHPKQKSTILFILGMRYEMVSQIDWTEFQFRVFIQREREITILTSIFVFFFAFGKSERSERELGHWEKKLFKISIIVTFNQNNSISFVIYNIHIWICVSIFYLQFVANFVH